MMARLIASLALLSVLLVAPAPVSGARQGAISRAYTLQRAREFLRAYNRHDLAGVLALLQTSGPGRHIGYGDCDYVFGTTIGSFGRDEVANWLRIQFAEGDRFVGMSVISRSPGEPGTAGFDFGYRINDILVARGIAPRRAGDKMSINAQGRFWKVVWVGPDCYQSQLPRQHPSVVKTRVITTAFLDAYKGHLTDRALQMLAQNVVYRGCDYRSDRLVMGSGLTAASRWLQSQFAAGDTLQRLSPVHATARAATVTVRLTGATLGAPKRLQMSVRTDPLGNGLQLVDLGAAGCP